MLEAGYIYHLTINRETSAGLFLVNLEGDEVLLPFKWAPDGFSKGDEIVVFIYPDSENRLIATTKLPFIESERFGLAKAREVTRFGAFMDIGTDKDLLVPFKEQKEEILPNREYVIYMYTDPQTGRLVGSTHIGSFLENESTEYKVDEQVELIIYETTDLGWNAIIDHQYRGLLYRNEVFNPIKIGDTLTGYIKQIRPDGRIDLKLRKSGYVHISTTTDTVMLSLKEHNGFLPLHDKSDPDLIYQTLGMSKKSFKQSIGLLYKERMIEIEEKGIRLRQIDPAKE